MAPAPVRSERTVEKPLGGTIPRRTSNGYYSLGQVSGKMTLFVQAIGHTGIWVDVDASRDTRLDIAMFVRRRLSP